MFATRRVILKQFLCSLQVFNNINPGCVTPVPWSCPSNKLVLQTLVFGFNVAAGLTYAERGCFRADQAAGAVGPTEPCKNVAISVIVGAQFCTEDTASLRFQLCSGGTVGSEIPRSELLQYCRRCSHESRLLVGRRDADISALRLAA